MELNDLKKYNLNYFAYIIGIIFLIRSLSIEFSIASYYSNFTIRVILTIIAALIGLSGLLLFKKNYKIAIVQYIIAIVGLLLGNLEGFYTFIFFILAAFLAFYEKDKSQNIERLDENSKFKLIYIPCISALILIILFASSIVLSDMEQDARMNAINITDLKADSAVEYDYPRVNITGKLVSSKAFSSISVKTYWYDESGAQIDETYDTGIKSEIKENQVYQLNTNYFGQKDAKLPSRAEITVQDLRNKEIIYSKNVTF